MDRTPYSKLAEHYDLGWGDFAESSRAFILRILAEHGIPAGTILELACGTGILATALARSGYEILGVDRSPNMIAQAQGRAMHVDGADFRIGDMRTLTPPTYYDAVLCMFDSLNYLIEPGDVSAVCAVVAKALRPGGLFVFDFNRSLIYSAHDGETLKRTVSGGILRQELHYEPARRIARTVFRFPDGEIEIHIQRAYDLREILPHLECAGLTLDACYSDFARRPVSSLSERLICVCTMSR